jgi:hypothetical protein
MKDEFSMGFNPMHDLLRGHHTDAMNDLVTALTDKANPLLSSGVRLFNNRDHDGNPIVKENFNMGSGKDWVLAAKQLGTYALSTILPFSARPFLTRPDLTTAQKVQGVFLPAAAKSVGMSDAQIDTRNALSAQRASGGMNDEDEKAGELKGQIIQLYKEGKSAEADKLGRSRTDESGHPMPLSDEQLNHLRDQSGLSSNARKFNNIEHVKTAVDIYRETEDKNELKSILTQKVNGSGQLSDWEKSKIRQEFGLNPPEKQRITSTDRPTLSKSERKGQGRSRGNALNNNFMKLMQDARAGNMQFGQ